MVYLIATILFKHAVGAGKNKVDQKIHREKLT
jgi:hypothetical protein